MHHCCATWIARGHNDEFIPPDFKADIRRFFRATVRAVWFRRQGGIQPCWMPFVTFYFEIIAFLLYVMSILCLPGPGAEFASVVPTLGAPEVLPLRLLFAWSGTGPEVLPLRLLLPEAMAGPEVLPLRLLFAWSGWLGPKCCHFGYFLPGAVAEPEVLPLRLLGQSLIQAGEKEMN